MAKRAMWTVLAVLVLGGAGAAGWRLWRGPVGSSTAYGGSIEARRIADFTSLDPSRWVNGAPTPISSARGEVVFIEAWAPAWGACRASVPAVIALERRFAARGLRVISVTKHGGDKDELKEVLEATKEEKMDYPCFLDPDGTWSKQAGVDHVPAFIVLDRAGRLAYRHGGKLMQATSAFDDVSQAIERALGANKPSWIGYESRSACGI
jgi:hypothetical protein